jgi:hypothetical protein
MQRPEANMVTPDADCTWFGANQGKNAAELPKPAAKEVSNPLRDPAPRAATCPRWGLSRCCHGQWIAVRQTQPFALLLPKIDAKVLSDVLHALSRHVCLNADDLNLGPVQNGLGRVRLGDPLPRRAP